MVKLIFASILILSDIVIEFPFPIPPIDPDPPYEQLLSVPPGPMA